jgi:hypothetical protein
MIKDGSRKLKERKKRGGSQLSTEGQIVIHDMNHVSLIVWIYESSLCIYNLLEKWIIFIRNGK